MRPAFKMCVVSRVQHGFSAMSGGQRSRWDWVKSALRWIGK
jgi:hypothetical protein